MAWVSGKDAAERLGITPRAVHKRAALGKLESRYVPSPGGGRPALEVWLLDEGEDLLPEKIERAEPGGTGRNRAEPSGGTTGEHPPSSARGADKTGGTSDAAPKTGGTRTGGTGGNQKKDPLGDWTVGLSTKQVDLTLFRKEVVDEILAVKFRERGTLKKGLAARVWNIPHSDRKTLSVATIQRWISLWNQGGVRALVPPETRSDYGVPKKMPLHVVEMIQSVFLKGLNRPDRLQRSAKQIIERVTTELKERDEADLVKLLHPRSVQRIIRPLRPREGGAPVKRIVRFESGEPNELWQADFSHSRLHIIRGKSYGVPRFFAWMDDRSRAVMGFYQWGESQQQADRSLMAALLGARAGVCPELVPHADSIPLRGKPSKMLVDNGRVYISKRMRMSLADMEIQLIRASAYHAQTKGKIERFFRELHRFEAELVRFHEVKKLNKQTKQEKVVTEQVPYLTLGELNELLALWLAKYHTDVHHYEGVEGKEEVVPLERWNEIERVIEVDPELLRRALMVEVTRKVFSDRKIRLEGRTYEVPGMYLRRSILIRYDPEDLGTIWFYDIGTKEPLAAGYQVGVLDNLTREAYAEIERRNAERERLAEPEAPPVELQTSYVDTLAREGEDAATLAQLSPAPEKREPYKFARAQYDTTAIAPLDALDMIERRFSRALDPEERDLVIEMCETEHLLPEIFERQLEAAMLDKAGTLHIRPFLDRVREAIHAARERTRTEEPEPDDRRTGDGFVFRR